MYRDSVDGRRIGLYACEDIHLDLPRTNDEKPLLSIYRVRSKKQDAPPIPMG